MTLAIDRTNRLLAWNGVGPFSCCETISIYQLPDLKLLKRQQIMVLSDAMRDHLCFSPSGKFLFALGGWAYQSDGLDAYDVDSLRFVWSHFADQPGNRLAFSPDEKKVAIIAGCKHYVSLLEINNGTQLKKIQCFPGEHMASDLAGFSQNGSCILTVEDGFISTIQIDNEKEIERKQIGATNAWIFDVWFSNGTLNGLSFDHDSSGAIYWKDHCPQPGSFPIPSARWSGNTVSHNGQYLAVTADYSVEKEPWPIYLFDLEATLPIWCGIDEENPEMVISMAVTDDGEMLFSEYAGNKVAVYNPKSDSRPTQWLE